MVSSDNFVCSTDERYSGEFEIIADLAAQQYIELIYDENKCRLVYLMNDAAESFLCFENFTVNGTYNPDYEGPVSAALEQNPDYYILIVRQGSENVFTVSFTGIHQETSLYNYGLTGHFWIKGHEKLRIIDYWLGLIREKYNILGPEYCNDTEKSMYHLAHFMPLRYYRSVPEKYMNENDYIYETTPEAADVFRQICSETANRRLHEISADYSDRKLKRTAAFLAGNNGSEAADIIIRKIREATECYPERSHAQKHTKLSADAAEKAEELEKNGYSVEMFREEPFENTEDTMKFCIFLLAQKRTLTGYKTELFRFEE